MTMRSYCDNNNVMNNTIKDIFTGNIKVLLLILLTSVILVIRDIAGIDVNQYLLFILMASFFVILDRKGSIIYLAYVCGIITGVNAYILLVGLFSVLIKDIGYLRHSKSFLYLALFTIVWEGINDLFNYPLSRIDQILLYFGYILVFFYYLMINKNKVENKSVIFYYSIGLAVTLLIISVGVLRNPIDMIFEGEGDVRAAMGFEEENGSTHFMANANNLAYFSIVLIALLISLKKQIFSSNVIFITLLTIAVLAGLLSRSRTWIILMSVLIIVEFVSRKGKDKFKFICSCIVLVFFALYFYSDFINTAIDGFSVRLKLDNVKTAGNRTVLMKEYFDYMSRHVEYMFTGTGAIYYKEITRCSNSCHNAFQQVYIAYGILGCLFFMSAMIKSITDHHNSSTIINFLPFIVALLFIQSIQLLNPFHLMIPLAVSSLAYKINNTSII